MDSEDRGCYDDSTAIGCSQNPAPAETAFLRDIYDVEITYVRGEVTRSDGDEANSDLVTVTVVLDFDNKGKAAIQLRDPEWAVTVSAPGDTLECSAPDAPDAVEPGEKVTVTTTCQALKNLENPDDPASEMTASVGDGSAEADLLLVSA